MTTLSFPQVFVEGLSTTGTLSVSVVDIVTIVFVVIFIIGMIWLANRQIKLSRESMRSSEILLESERDSLERRISERTTAFVRAEEQRMIELQKNAEFGKLSRGLFHDLISPLSSISLYAQQLDKNFADSDKTKEIINTVIESSKRMNSFMESVRRSFGNEAIEQNKDSDSENKKANIGKEIDIVLDILGYKARMAGVKIEVDILSKDPMYFNIHPVRLHQLILNLVSNAIDACIEKNSNLDLEHGSEENSDHKVKISVIKNAGAIELSVSDTGCGISIENQKKLFKEQFTTKKDGSGIGLMTIKTIVEKDLAGTIEVKSEVGEGARFIVKIPRLKRK